jgi:hypothetical protein
VQYIVNVNSAPQPGGKGGNANFSLQVEAPNVLGALEAAKTALEDTITAAGLQPAPPPRP